ncbi:MAG: MarR family transcriptional regulator [Deltaproteobacteria bacterium]|nr:MarR family transcriptional regulator [Deltaproteobacteria bacterium]
MSWMHYNPHRADPGLLDRITSGESRLQLRDTLLEVIRNESDRKSHQHQLLIGARGAGKTHLLRVVAHRVITDSELERSWRPVVLAEEQGIRGPSELFGALVSRIATDLEKTDLAAARAASVAAKQMVGKSRGEVAMRLGFEGLRSIASALDRKILAVVENLDALFFRGVGGGKKEADAELWGLRKYLQDADFLLLFAAAPTYFGAASDHGAAFHGAFREHMLDSLPLDEVIHIARQHLELVAHEGKGARSQRARDLLDRFETNRGRLAGMLRITGGLPRFAHLIVELLIDAEDADAETQLERLLDEQTPYFQGRLDPRLIPPGELEALATLARASGPLRPSELARRAGIQTGEASVLLERLRERGLARRSGSLGAATGWDVAEPLYRVWMAFREGGEQRSVMVALTEMVAALYSADELTARAEAASCDGHADNVWAFALTRGPSLDNEPSTPGREEARFQAARAALSEAEAKGAVPAEVLIDFVEKAWRTGRIDAGRQRLEQMLKAAGSDPQHQALALLTSAMYPGSDAAARAADAATLSEQQGLTRLAIWAKGRHGELLEVAGHREEAAAVLVSTYEAAVAQKEDTLLSWLALLTSLAVATPTARLEWLRRAREHATPGTIDEANTFLEAARMARTREEMLDWLARAAAIYRLLGTHEILGACLISECQLRCEGGELDLAIKSLADAVDLFLEHDAVFALDVWGPLHDFAVWGPRPVALVALHELAACTNQDAIRATAEAWMITSAVRLLAESARPHEEILELLQTARDDLTRERRALLEPFVLAARMEAEDPDAVLFEQAEQMRAVVADVRRRVSEVRKLPPRARPKWAVSAGPPTRSRPKRSRPE